MNDAIKDKMKAVIEAMLFVAVQPVPINKMVKKLRQVAKKEAANNEIITDEITAEEPLVEQSSADAENQESIVEDITDNGQPETENELETSETLELSEEEDTNQEVLTEPEQSESSDMSEESEQPVSAESSDAASEIDPMQQLLNKQQELQEEITSSDVKTILLQIQEDLNNQDHGVELVAVAKGYQLRTKYEISMYLKEEKVQTPSRFSPSSLETLSIIAYQQPITKQKIEDIRGVDSGGVLKTLLDKNIIRMVGRSEDAGRAIVYGTSKKFLEVFGLNNLSDLPNLSDYQTLRLSEEDDEEEKSFNQETFEEHGFVGDLMDDAVDYLTQEEEAILGDLNDSIKSLRQVEKTIVKEHFEEPVSAEGFDAASPVSAEGSDVVNPDQTTEGQETEQNTDNGLRETDNENKEAHIS